MTECKRCHAVDTMFWWPVSFGEWEDRFYLCDDCLHDLLQFLREPTELVIPKKAESESKRDFMDERTCPSCGARLWLVNVPAGIYGCPTCFRKYDRYGKEVPQ